MKFTAAALTTLTLLTPVLAIPAEVREVRPLMRDMTPRATFNEAEGVSPFPLLSSPFLPQLPNKTNPRTSSSFPHSVFSFATPASCSILSCINVIAEAVCIAEAIDDENWQGIFTCAKKKEVCCPLSLSLPLLLSLSLFRGIATDEVLLLLEDSSAAAPAASVPWARSWRSTVFADWGWGGWLGWRRSCVVPWLLFVRQLCTEYKIGLYSGPGLCSRSFAIDGSCFFMHGQP